MNKNTLRRLALASFLTLSFSAALFAQDKEVIIKRGFTLTFINQDKSFSPVLRTRMINTFFKVYPLLKKDFNNQTSRDVTFVIDTAYKGVAATSAAIVSYSPVWFKQHPEDIDVVTHEVMHIVQAYGNNAGPWWITEGIADYVRYAYGVDNAGAKWALTPFKITQNYDNGYRITARFFAWLEKNGYPGIVKSLDKHMRAHTFTDEVWKTETTKTLAELWAAYSANPAL
jgi:hypothetical protein